MTKHVESIVNIAITFVVTRVKNILACHCKDKQFANNSLILHVSSHILSLLIYNVIYTCHSFKVYIVCFKLRHSEQDDQKSHITAPHAF